MVIGFQNREKGGEDKKLGPDEKHCQPSNDQFGRRSHWADTHLR